MLLPDLSAAAPRATTSNTMDSIAEGDSSAVATALSKRQKVHGERTGEKAQYREKRKTEVKLPKKKYYRQRAHANPFSDHNLA